jgi:NAD-dependent SIR2 family protein deacetylase
MAPSHANIVAAAEAIRSADALLIGAGAGMGVDSGLPDFRGPEGFWKAYPPFRGRQFHEMSTPHWFHTDPALAWGFFGHRLNLYRSAVPHAGFEILKRWAAGRSLGAFVFTSNVDGQFQKSGFPDDALVERHGSIHYLQCTAACGCPLRRADEVQIDVDPATIRARSRPPTCSDCGAIVRPNILMFDDFQWDHRRYFEQRIRYEAWLRRVQSARIVAVELGAGLAIPTVRHECEQRSAFMVRINPRDSAAPRRGVSLPLGAAQALAAIDARLQAD